MLSVMLNEFFKTWFPYSKDCVVACPVLKVAEDIYSDSIGKEVARVYPQIEFSQGDNDTTSPVEILIIEDSKSDLGIVKMLHDNQRMIMRIFNNLREYINWQQHYNDKDGDNIDNKYLYFGNDSEPACFDFKTLSTMLNEIHSERRVNAEIVDDENVDKEAATNEAADAIISKVISPSMNQLEKEIAIHDYIVANFEYDYANYQRGTIPKASYTAYGLLVRGKAVCAGYAEAFVLLMKKVGIECIVVSGYGKEERHAWNQVRIDDVWYNVDITWDDPVPDTKGHVLHTFFNKSDATFSENHKWDQLRYNVCPKDMDYNGSSEQKA